MVEVRIGTNESGQRFDRFLRKYLPKAPLSFIYKAIRKDAKVNGRREKNTYLLRDGDLVTLYMAEDEIRDLRKKPESARPRKTFRVAYEDEDVLICDKPLGLLVHGDKNEKGDHLTNQVKAYLAGKGDFDQNEEKTFAPSPVNRIDRNTTGLVIFAKTYPALKALNRAMRERDGIRKFYLTIACGEIKEELVLEGSIEKDESRNLSRVSTDRARAEDAKAVKTFVRPVKVLGSDTGASGKVTLAEVEIETGRTHQIRVQLADAGHPLVGDPKYGDRRVNKYFAEKYGVRAQILTAYRLEFGKEAAVSGLSGKEIKAELPKIFDKIEREMDK